jgi:hypothetical protein
MRRDMADRSEEAVGMVGLTGWKFDPAGGAQSALDPLEWLQKQELIGVPGRAGFRSRGLGSIGSEENAS